MARVSPGAANAFVCGLSQVQFMVTTEDTETTELHARSNDSRNQVDPFRPDVNWCEDVGMRTNMQTIVWTIALGLSVMRPAWSQSIATEAEPVRGVWVANVVSGVLDSTEAIRDFVELCDECGLNTLCVVTWNRGMTVYPSDVMQREFGIRRDPRYEERDPLSEIIDAAHARGMRVIAWFEFGFSCSYRQPDGGRIPSGSTALGGQGSPGPGRQQERISVDECLSSRSPEFHDVAAARSRRTLRRRWRAGR